MNKQKTGCFALIRALTGKQHTKNAQGDTLEDTEFFDMDDDDMSIPIGGEPPTSRPRLQRANDMRMREDNSPSKMSL